jgi:hypothetical protein
MSVQPVGPFDQAHHSIRVEHGHAVGAVREYTVVVSGLTKSHLRGFDLRPRKVVKLELDSYPSHATLLEDNGGEPYEPWDIAIFEGGQLAALILGRVGQEPKVVWVRSKEDGSLI